MKIIINKYDNGFSVIALDKVVNRDGQEVERRRTAAIQGGQAELVAHIQTLIPENVNGQNRQAA
jgi:hypothetical protein